jgi:predicted phage tail protein
MAPFLLLLPLGSADLVPMPPGHLDYELEFHDALMSITLNWTAPAGSANKISYFAVHQANLSVGATSIIIPAATIDYPGNTYTIQSVPDDSTYLFYVTSVDFSGIQSPPSNPVLVRAGYPHCGVISWGIDPPHVHPTPGCLTPPPV